MKGELGGKSARCCRSGVTPRIAARDPLPTVGRDTGHRGARPEAAGRTCVVPAVQLPRRGRSWHYAAKIRLECR